MSCSVVQAALELLGLTKGCDYITGISQRAQPTFFLIL